MKEGMLALSLSACLAAAGLSHGSEPATDTGGLIELNRATQVRTGLHHWSGPRDGSVKVHLHRSEELLIVEVWLRDDVPFRLTMSLTPPLAGMLSDPLLQDRYLRHLDQLIELSEKEIDRTRRMPEYAPLARQYRDWFIATQTGC